MVNFNNNPIAKYMLILYVCFALLIAQGGGLHMHVQHDGHSSPVEEHVVDIHAASILHHVEGGDYHLAVTTDNHHLTFEVSQNTLIKKVNSFDLMAMLVFIIGLFLLLPRFLNTLSRWYYQPTAAHSSSYFLSPQLRAPPHH